MVMQSTANQANFKPLEKGGISNESILDNLTQATGKLTVREAIKRINVTQDTTRLWKVQCTTYD